MTEEVIEIATKKPRKLPPLKEEEYVPIEVFRKYNMSRKQWDFMEHYIDGKTQVEIQNLLGITNFTVWNWKKTEWFQELFKFFNEQKQNDVRNFMSAKSEQILQAYFDIVTGANPNDRTANARMKGVQLFLEMGDNPVLNKNPQLNINTSTVNNTIQIDSSELDAKLQSLSADDLDTWLNTGEEPKKIKVINE